MWENVARNVSRGELSKLLRHDVMETAGEVYSPMGVAVFWRAFGYPDLPPFEQPRRGLVVATGRISTGQFSNINEIDDIFACLGGFEMHVVNEALEPDHMQIRDTVAGVLAYKEQGSFFLNVALGLADKDAEQAGGKLWQGMVQVTLFAYRFLGKRGQHS